MSSHARVLGAMVLGLVLARAAGAQEKPVTISVRGGGFNSVTNLNDSGTADLKKIGFGVGGAVGVDLNRYLGLRADFTFARNQLRQNDINTGTHLNRSFFDGALQVSYPLADGVRPYGFIGAGGVRLHPAGTSGLDQTKFAGTVGLGVGCTIPGTSLGLFLEGQHWLYKLSGVGGSLDGYDRTQFDIAWSAGVSYRLPIGASTATQASR